MKQLPCGSRDSPKPSQGHERETYRAQVRLNETNLRAREKAMDLSLKDIYQIVSEHLPEDGPHKLNKDYVIFRWKDKKLYVRINSA